MTEVNAELEALRKDLKRLRADMKDLLGAAKNDGTGKVEELKDRLMTAARDWESRAEESLRHVYETTRERGEEAVERGREEVRKRPLTIVLSALGIGVVLGLLLRRR